MTKDIPTAMQEAIEAWNERDEDNHVELDCETFHPSQIAQDCPRQTYLSKLGLKDNSDALGYFLRGTLLHEFFEEELSSETGDSPLDTEYEANLEFEQDLEATFDDIRITGRCDIIDTENDIIYDLKTRGNYYRFDPPKQRHLDQLHTYMGLAGANEGVVIYISASDPTDIRTWPPQDSDEDTFDFDASRFKTLLDRVRDIREEIDQHGIPSSPHEIPYEKCGCYLCDEEELDMPADDADITTSPLPRRAEG